MIIVMTTHIRVFGNTIFLCLLFFFVPRTAVAERVWGEYGIATVYVGNNEQTGVKQYRKINLGTLGPDTFAPPNLHQTVRHCGPIAARAAGEPLSKRLD